VFKKRRRHNYRRKAGHRQQLTILKIVSIGDKKAEKKAAPKARKPLPLKPPAPRRPRCRRRPRAPKAEAEKPPAPKAEKPPSRPAGQGVDKGCCTC
jgi:large subunit ribosomal protein L21